MADSQNNAPAKFDKDSLKEWFTLAEVAARWTVLTGQTITEDDLLQYAALNRIRLSINTYGKKTVRTDFCVKHIAATVEKYCPESEFTDEEAHFECVKNIPSRELYNGSKYPNRERIERFCFLRPNQVKTIFLEKKPLKGGFFLLEEPDSSMKCGFNYRSIVLDTVITREDLLVLSASLCRFEQDHGISQLGMITEKPKPHEPETNTKKTKLDKQITAILDAAKRKKYDPLKIPDGGKTEIQAIVSTDPETKSLFAAESAFKTAWSAARNRSLVKMENHDSYAKSNR